MQAMAVDEYERRRMISVSPHWQWFEVFDKKYYEMLELINGSRVDGPGYVSSLVVVWFFVSSLSWLSRFCVAPSPKSLSPNGWRYRCIYLEHDPSIYSYLYC